MSVLALAHPLAYIGMFAGDAEIHLVFGRSAAEGRFFEFNPGEAVAGETSPGYMLLLAALFRAAPEAWVPLLVKAGNLLAWYALVALTFFVARRLLGSERWALAAGAVLALTPGSAYNATTGMENGLFALAVLAIGWAAIRTGWWDRPERATARADAALGAALGALCWLRPEGFVVAALAIAVRAARLAPERGMREAARGAGVAIAACLPLAAGVVLFQAAFTGEVVPSSGLSRVASAAARSTAVAGLPFDPKLAVWLAAYFPLTAAFAAGAWLFLSGRDRTARPASFGFGVALVGTFFALYGTVAGAAHLARYLLFVMPFFVIAACHGAKWLWERWAERVRAPRLVRRALAVLCVAPLAAVFAAEAVERRALGSHDELSSAAAAPFERRAFSDWLYERAGRPPDLPVILACQEVQVRYFLDDRFVVRSLDGRVDPVLLRFVRDGYYDHVGYIRERRVAYLYSKLNNYNRDRGLWSLERLNALEPGASAAHGGLRFTRLDWFLVRVDASSIAEAGS